MINLQELSNSITSYQITALIDTALCIGAGGSSGSLADKPIVRNSEGNLLIPASQLKGRLRHECEKIARGLCWKICYSPNPQTMCPQRAGLTGNFERSEYQLKNYEEQHHCLICQIFGNPALQSRAIFDDLICTEEPDNLPEVVRPGVTINRRRRIAEEQKLYFLETSPANAQLKFTGHIHLSGAPVYAAALILAGLRHINALGGSKSAGLGWLHWKFPALALEQEAWDFLAKGGVQ
ncbi:CRISPR-associated protein Csm3 [Brasilonema octagenarum UFV-E1]|uniref:CRISPR-associated protein Csm3 n=2 Tax=Brasilonema TaxID=383614 RepID=A0A856MEQ8_9CYAN|nr:MULTISPECIES: RAMP superfamily CRISPR-associated protein [Brasilonema]NMF66459.1 CRISPR-associated protein Csm3 [Brasilonema octagenarum UFV-OR1]QDL09815.1 CRISPR-associated protein Csm3 [Brasilonema sennae CENA114]QDL16169.1 CRISPR-associated protein Csm3 [Brasilonema octagenarum UFV-E1]